MQNKPIIRNKLKIKAATTNAQSLIKIIDEFGSFYTYTWQIVNHTPIVNNFKPMSDIPPVSLKAEKMSKDLKNKGFKFDELTIYYAFIQATGMVNDHIVSCKKHNEITEKH